MATTDEMERLSHDLEELQNQVRPKSAADRLREEVLATLDKLAAGQISENVVVYEGTRFVLPEVMDGDLPGAIKFLRQLAKAEEQTYEFTRYYRYRPFDGAAAFQRALLRVFGTEGVGQQQAGFFGVQPPQYMTIPVGAGENIQVPWGQVSFAPLDATFDLGGGRGPDRDDGIIFVLSVEAPRKHRRRIDGFMTVVEDELAQRSIYRGKAVDGNPDPGFVDLSKVDPSRVVYAREAETQLTANLWTVIDHADNLRALGVPLKRAVLVEGPYGSGKTLGGALTGQRAVGSGWTFILVRAGQDPFAALHTARLYAPSVVWIEDIDRLIAEKSRDELSRLLDVLDGVQAKGAEVVVGFTTNFADKIDKGVLRPGRIDSVIHIAELDADGYERLVKVTVPAHLLQDIDYAAVAQAYDGFLPAFAVEAAERAIRYSLARNRGGKPEAITTADLVHAAEGLRPQLALLEAAAEASHAVPTIDKLVDGRVADVLSRTTLDGSPLVVGNQNGRH
jgi:transitional endoplasmic reticulum ATPase